MAGRSRIPRAWVDDVLLRLLLAFTLIPLAELALLLRIGEWLGVGATLGLVVGTGVAGAWLARREGVRAWAAVRDELAAGRLPGEELLHAVLILLAGVVLVTPGVLTDAAGLLLMLRPLRQAAVRRIRGRLAGRVEIAAHGWQGGPATRRESGAEGPEPEAGRPAGAGRVIDI